MLKKRTWERHVDPWSVWTRVSAAAAVCTGSRSARTARRLDLAAHGAARRLDAGQPESLRAAGLYRQLGVARRARGARLAEPQGGADSAAPRALGARPVARNGSVPDPADLGALCARPVGDRLWGHPRFGDEAVVHRPDGLALSGHAGRDAGIRFLAQMKKGRACHRRRALFEECAPDGSDLRQRLFQIGDDVLDILDADRQADHVRPGAGALQLIGRKLAMRRRGRMDDQRARIAEIGEMRKQLHARNDLHAFIVAALETEGEDGACAARGVLLLRRNACGP